MNSRLDIERRFPAAFPDAIGYILADPYGIQAWHDSVAKLPDGYRLGDGPTVAPEASLESKLSHLGTYQRYQAPENVTLPETVDQRSIPEGLEALDSYTAINAERRRNAKGPEIDQRARVYASALEVDAKQLVKLVQSMLGRVPTQSRDPNRLQNQDDLEQAIWAKLWASKAWATGSWERVKVVISGAYKNWYTVYANERQLGVEATNRAISLERAYAREQQSDSEPVGYDVPDDGWVGWQDAVEANADAWWAMTALPDKIQGIVERKSNGVPISQTERNQLTKFLAGGPTKKTPSTPTNKQVLANVMKGTHVGPIRWSTPSR